jgi:hypothetical protein
LSFPVARLKYCRLSDSISHTNSFESGKKFDYTKSQNTLNNNQFNFLGKIWQINPCNFNTLWTGDANLRLLRFCITTVKDRWRKFAF